MASVVLVGNDHGLTPAGKELQIFIELSLARFVDALDVSLHRPNDRTFHDDHLSVRIIQEAFEHDPLFVEV